PDGDIGVRIADAEPNLSRTGPGRAIGEPRRCGVALAGGDGLLAEGRDHHVGRGGSIEILLIAKLARGEQDQDDGDEPHDATPFPASAPERMPARRESPAKVNKSLMEARD